MFTLRSPRPSDAPGLGRAWEDARALYADLDPAAYLPPDPTRPVGEYVASRLMERQASPSSFVVVAVDTDDEAVGFAEAELGQATNSSPHRMARHNAHPRVGIEALFVQRSHWRRGVGRLLIDAVESWAQRSGAVAIRLTAHARSISALAFYDALGYDRVGVVFSKTFDDSR